MDSTEQKEQLKVYNLQVCFLLHRCLVELYQAHHIKMLKIKEGDFLSDVDQFDRLSRN